MGEHASARAVTDYIPELMDALASVAAPDLYQAPLSTRGKDYCAAIAGSSVDSSRVQCFEGLLRQNGGSYTDYDLIS